MSERASALRQVRVEETVSNHHKENEDVSLSSNADGWHLLRSGVDWRPCSMGVVG